MSLLPQPAFLAGREELLAELDTRLTGGAGAGPQIVVLYGLGGAGKTSVALEYAYRHLAEVRVAWQFAADSQAVLAAGFAELVAQLGARERRDPRDPVVSAHAVLAAYPADWLLVFDNAPDPGLLTWSEIWCDVDNSKRFRSSCSRHVSQGHRLKGVAALHNFLASIFTAPGVTTWRGMSGNTRKNQVTRLVTLRHQSTMSGALRPGIGDTIPAAGRPRPGSDH